MEREIVVISGKGGTGKTSLTAALAFLASGAVLADCDVDAADLHLVTSPEIRQAHDFVGGKKAMIRREDCRGCGRCRSLCRFDAIRRDETGGFAVDSLACEGCRVCVEFCPAGAIDFVDTVNGRWFVSETRLGPMVHAELGIAQENSGKLVSRVRREAKHLAQTQRLRWILSDGSPGTGCPVIASVTGADFALIVTEPTLSGRHDLRRTVELTRHFGVRAGVCINKADINPEVAANIERETVQNGLPLLAALPYDTAVTQAQSEAKTIMELPGSTVAGHVRALWNQIQKRILYP